eukprot:CAMPEP_0206456716 /NCGR_PEP_ID=MMETSP0324_2-20121206/22536_1 /ASSEMBLY_ACC=CAM_ASM_000836 /TAXON_ID=2866 /ORGANISM="Crypthecodinium cohnii, Strain Seligo" /LENGTH=284 /DNA_ID=CAMNT_0053927709 /DNA_START=141 /DNA_END=995 /DNA_ORIENTATION=-
MSSVYGPALLKNPTTEDNVDEAVGRKKRPEDQFETDHDRSKRIRRERQEQKKKDAEAAQKQQMSQAISALLGSSGAGGSSSSKKGADVGAAGPQFMSFGQPGPLVPGPPSPGPAPGPAVGPSGGPAPGPAGPSGPSKPSKTKTKGPAKPAPEDIPAKAPAEPEKEKEKAAAPKVRLGHMDHFAEQKRVSWDELKANLAKANLAEEGVPGSNQFDSYSAKLEKERNDRLQAQELETKKMLKHINKGKGVKDKKKKKDKKEKKAAASSDESSEADDALLKRYNKSA